MTPPPSNRPGYTGEHAPIRFNLARYCLAAAAPTPGKPALVIIDDAARPEPAEVWTYSGLERAVLRIAGEFRRLGLAAGERVVIRLDNRSSYPLAFFGAIAAGLVAVPLSSALTAEEVEAAVADCAAAAVVAAPQLAIGRLAHGVRVIEEARLVRAAASAEPVDFADTQADEPAFLVYTSGTTARPKGVLHAQRAAWGRRPMYRGWYGIGADDRLLHAGAFNWTFTLGTGLMDPFANGATALVYTGPRDPAIWPSLIAAHGVTLFAAVPGVFRQLLKHATGANLQLGALRHALTAGEALPETVAADWTARCGRPIYEALGMSELSTFISSSPATPRRPGTCGKPQPGRSVAILPVEGGETPLVPGSIGLLAAHRSDPGLMLGYWRRPEEEAAVWRGDWFVGGDLAAIDADGYVTHHGRADDVIKALGYRVSPQEVEAVLGRHPAVAEVACNGLTVADGVTVVAAFVVLRDGVTVDADELMRFAAAHLAAYKCPRQIRFVRTLPHTANGKLMRRGLGGLDTPDAG